MKRPGYRASVAWIAHNDDPGETNPDMLEGMITVGLVADQFGVESSRVADDVIKLRIQALLDERRREREKQ